MLLSNPTLVIWRLVLTYILMALYSSGESFLTSISTGKYSDFHVIPRTISPSGYEPGTTIINTDRGAGLKTRNKQIAQTTVAAIEARMRPFRSRFFHPIQG